MSEARRDGKFQLAESRRQQGRRSLKHYKTVKLESLPSEDDGVWVVRTPFQNSLSNL